MKTPNIIVNTVNPIRNLKYPPIKARSLKNLKEINYIPCGNKMVARINFEEKYKNWYDNLQKSIYPSEKRRYLPLAQNAERLLEMFKKEPELISTLVSEPASEEDLFFPYLLFNQIETIFNQHPKSLSKIKILFNHKKGEIGKRTHIFQSFNVSTILDYGKNLPDEDFEKWVQMNDKEFDYKDNFDLMLLSLNKPQEMSKFTKSGGLDLIKKNKINQNIVNLVHGNKTFSDDTLNDLKKLNNEEANVIILPENTKPQTIKTLLNTGEVCEINNKLYIHDDETIVPLKLTREKFEELFPIYERSLIQQGDLGDCWILASIDALVSNPKGKSRFYKLFEQDGNDILIKFPNGKQKIRFKNGEPLDVIGLQGGAKGYKLVEQAYMIHRKNHYSTTSKETCINDIEIEALKNYATELQGGFAKDAIETFLGYKEDKTKSSILKKIKFWQNTETKQIRKTILEGANDKNYITYLSFFAKDALDEECLFKAYGIRPRHAYALKGYDAQSNTIKLSNPHNTNVLIEAPVKAIFNNIANHCMIKLQPLEQETL